jgi:peptide chain release factor 1
MQDPNVYADPALYAKLAREQKELSKIVEAYRQYKKAEKTMEDACGLMSDPEMKEMAQEEYDTARRDMDRIEEEIKILLLPSDPNDSKNVIIEIRGGAGGEEAALFANSLYRMYSMYADSKRWKTEIANLNETELGGIKEIVFQISGTNVWRHFKFERGIHRVQRVPETEASGRIHTSAVSVAVLPVTEEVDIEVRIEDLRIDTYRASGAGGQYVNKTESAIRITHLPTGIVVACQDERSQLKNRAKAFKILRAKLYEKQQQERQQATANDRTTRSAPATAPRRSAPTTFRRTA